MKWVENEKYTVVGVSDMMAMTTKGEIQCKGFQGEKPYFSEFRKRKKFFLRDNTTEQLIFKGWNIDLKIDSESKGKSDGVFTSRIMRGNACYNFLGSAEFVKKFIDENNLNEYFNRYDSVLAHEDEQGEDGIPVYPEVATTHAVILNIRKKLGMDKAPEVVYSYGREEAVNDGILMSNPRRDAFNECDMMTCNLFERIEEIRRARDLKRVFEYAPLELVGCLMVGAKEKYEKGEFEGDNDKDFFVIPKNEEGMKVWFVRNEAGKLTAMLPEDY